MNYTLRKALTDDLELSFEIRKNAMMKYIERSKGWDEEKEMQGHIEDFNTDVMQIIEARGKPIGVFESVVECGNIYVHGLYILDEFQNFKIGSRIIKDIIHKADTEKISILLQVLKVNTQAKEFYVKHGFKISEGNESYCKMIYKNVE
ncbi:MAG: GNAT family N-acetyltransferase [Ignavibacteria bacterium]